MSLEQIEKIEELVRQIHGPKLGDEVSKWWIWEKHYDDKVIYYLKLGVSVEELEERLKERQAREKREYERQRIKSPPTA